MTSANVTPLCVLHVLVERSDENNILPQPKILEYLLEDHRIEITRHTFYRAINVLISLGFEIETYNDNHKGYFLKSRYLNEEQAILLCSQVECMNTLPPDEKLKVRQAFLKALSEPMSKTLLKIFSKEPGGNENTELMKTLKIASRAIRDRHMVTFDYIHYNQLKEEIYDDRPFENEEPRLIVTKDSRYYLITSGGRHNSKNNNFRIDKIRNMRIVEKPVSESYNYLDAYQYALNTIFMFSGKSITAHFRVSKELVNIYDLMLDEFGPDVTFKEYDKDWFDVIVSGSFKGLKLFAQKYSDQLYVISPPSLRDAMIELHKKNLNRYFAIE